MCANCQVYEAKVSDLEREMDELYNSMVEKGANSLSLALARREANSTPTSRVLTEPKD